MLLFSSIDLESVFDWLCDLQKDYSHNNDIWDLRRHWESLKHIFLHQMNTGTYQFNALDVYVHGDVSIYLWSSLDMIALKLITQALSSKISVPSSCYHTKGNGGLKKGVKITSQHLVDHTYVFRTDVKSFYDSINFDVLMGIVESYIQDPVLLTLLRRALMRAENCGGNFTFYNTQGLEKNFKQSAFAKAPARHSLSQAIATLVLSYPCFKQGEDGGFSWIQLGLCECKDFLEKSCLSILPQLMNLNST